MSLHMCVQLSSRSRHFDKRSISFPVPTALRSTPYKSCDSSNRTQAASTLLGAGHPLRRTPRYRQAAGESTDTDAHSRSRISKAAAAAAFAPGPIFRPRFQPTILPAAHADAHAQDGKGRSIRDKGPSQQEAKGANKCRAGFPPTPCPHSHGQQIKASLAGRQAGRQAGGLLTQCSL